MSTQTSDPRSESRKVRARTVVFGLAVLAISVTVLLTTLTSLHLSGTAIALAVLIGAGTLLLVAGVLAAVREAQGGPGGTRA